MGAIERSLGEMHPIEVTTEDRGVLSYEGRVGWWILMALVAVTIVVVALVIVPSGTGMHEEPQQRAPIDQAVDRSQSGG